MKKENSILESSKFQTLKTVLLKKRFILIFQFVAAITFAQYDSLNFYTLFIYNQQANGPVRAVRIHDDFSKLTQTKSFYRFFHASPNTDAVDLYMDNVKIESEGERKLKSRDSL